MLLKNNLMDIDSLYFVLYVLEGNFELQSFRKAHCKINTTQLIKTILYVYTNQIGFICSLHNNAIHPF